VTAMIRSVPETSCTIALPYLAHRTLHYRTPLSGLALFVIMTVLNHIRLTASAAGKKKLMANKTM